MEIDNKYTLMQKSAYSGGTSNHLEHNNNSKYWNILLSDLSDYEAWEGKTALDFGCGKGRNVTNMLSKCDWKRVDGIDISESNIIHCKITYENQNSKWYVNNGIDVSCLKSDEYDFIMSTIVLQHIPVYDIRRSIISDLFRCLKSGGIFSFQMGFGADTSLDNKSSYYDNSMDASGTNSAHDVSVTDANEVVKDMEDIGFTNVTYQITDNLSDSGQSLDYGHPNWIWVRCEKS
jgi:SAM-dependent methyltransferase